MDKFDNHFKMSEQDAIEYICLKTDFFDKGASLSCKEIGDGNINYVFRIMDVQSNKSVILKHSDITTRSSKTVLDTDHNRIEAEILKLEGELAPGLVPEIYLYDPVMCCMVMEDLRDFENMRYALIAHKTFQTFAEDISTFMANVLIKTTDSILSPKKKKEMAVRYINPDLCDITERLVYTDPYTNDSGKNVLFGPNEAFLQREIYEDMALRLEVAKLKEQFKSKTQSLLHGDLHTGSIFIRDNKAMVLDPEFAFYGPAGYDVGNVIANLIFAWANAEVTMEHGLEQEKFQQWIEQSIVNIVELFSKKTKKILIADATDIMAKSDGFADWIVADILTDTAGAVGTELIRRIIGTAKVKDVAGIATPQARVLAEKICVLSGKEFIMHRTDAYQDGHDYIAIIKKITDRLR